MSPRVERGAALLDVHAPGWEGKIDLDMLDLASDSYCVVGQVYGTYTTGITTIDGDADRHPAHYGFIAQMNEDYDALTRKWHAFITRRRAKREAA